jgi:hypothetical protein
VRGEWGRNKWVTGEASRGRLGLYIGLLARGARCTHRRELDGEGGVSGRRCELGLGGRGGGVGGVVVRSKI